MARDLGWLAAAMGTAGASAALLPAAGAAAPIFALTMVAGQLMIVGRLRRLVVGHTHEATHGVVTKFYRGKGLSKREARRRAEAMLDIGSALTLTLNGQDYRRKHGPHHTRRLGTLRDPDGAMLAKWGFWPGALKHGLYTTLALRLIDPRWHLAFLRDRLASNLLRGRLYRRAAGLAALAGLIAPLAVMPFPVWLAMIGLPWTIGYQTAAVLQSLTEHPYGFDHLAEDAQALSARSWQRYPYRPMPEPGLRGLTRLRAWAGWGVAIAGHAVARMAIYDDTMVNHGFHHDAWPEDAAFLDYWNTDHRHAAWRRAHPEREEHAVWGLPGALRRQKAMMEARG
jgi:hypothetical protein